MRRLSRMLTAAIIGTGSALVPSLSYAQSPHPPQTFSAPQTARAMRGAISGTVHDERGGPVHGAMVTALGATMAMTISDERGQFSIDALPVGEYILRANLTGFASSQRELVRVGMSSPATHRLQLRRLDTPVGTTGTITPVSSRPIMAAGFGLPPVTLLADGKADEDGHPHNETAWRLRHIKRSVLKDASTPAIALADGEPELSDGSLFGRAVDSAATLAGAIFTDLPFSGEVNLLTTGAFGPGALFTGDGFPRGVAYLAIGAPTPAGDWSVRAAMSEGDLSSWIVAGAFASKPGSSHGYKFGLSYSTQEYLGGNPAALAAMTDGSRNVGEIYGFDRWALGSKVAVEYGGRYARYDYLQEGGLLSPRVGVTVEPFRDTRIKATVAQRMIAPGAEEFLAHGIPGPWLPPERTFAPLGGPGDTNAFSVERARSFDVLLEHEFDATFVVGMRRFYQTVDDQLVTLFGRDAVGDPQAVGHYYVASAGSVDADGWAVHLSSPQTKRVRGSVNYSVTRARWVSRGDMTAVAAWAPAAIRPQTEDLHDVTTSLETDIPETATRVFILYKLNTGYTGSNSSFARPGLDARFDVQVNQALPLSLAGTRWEVLVGIRNLFRDPNDPGSVYDELLVVRPPKRVVGGFLVRF
jgi:hypothetical protein